MNNTFGASGLARTGAGQAGSDSPMVRPIRPVKAVPAGYSLRSPPPPAGLVSRSRSLLMVPPVSLENPQSSSRCPPAPDDEPPPGGYRRHKFLAWRALGHFYGIGDAAINPPRHRANGSLRRTPRFEDGQSSG